MKLILLGLIAGLTSGAAVAAPAAADYIAKAGAGDLYEIESSELVAKSTHNDKLKSFADMMVNDHTKSTADVKAAAKASGMSPKPPMLDAKKKADLAALTKAQGTNRDALYMTQQKSAHAEALALHKDYADGGDKPALKAVAAKMVPVVEHHKELLSSM